MTFALVREVQLLTSAGYWENFFVDVLDKSDDANHLLGISEGLASLLSQELNAPAVEPCKVLTHHGSCNVVQHQDHIVVHFRVEPSEEN